MGDLIEQPERYLGYFVPEHQCTLLNTSNKDMKGRGTASKLILHGIFKENNKEQQPSKERKRNSREEKR